MKNFKLYENFLNEGVDDGSSIILDDMNAFEIVVKDVLSSQGIQDCEFESFTFRPGDYKIFSVSFKLWFIKNSGELVPRSKVAGPYFTEQEAKDALDSIEIGHLDFLKKWKPSVNSDSVIQGLCGKWSISRDFHTHPSTISKYLTNNLEIDHLSVLLDGKDFVKLCSKNGIDLKSFIEKNRSKISGKKYGL